MTWETHKQTGLSYPKATSSTEPQNSEGIKTKISSTALYFYPTSRPRKPPEVRQQLEGMLSSVMTPV